MKDLLDILLDKENKDPIVLSYEKGKQVVFEQVAVVPFEIDGEKRLYVVLRPISKMKGIADDEAIVFYLDQDENGNTVLQVEEDELIAIDIFDKYYDLLEETRKNKKNGQKDERKQ